MPLTPFSKQQLLPQEEKLEIARHKSELFIGIPKETSYQERRICLTPDAVSSLVSHGHRVLLEAGAGESASYSDKEYSDAGAEITQDPKKVLSCPMILKVEPLTICRNRNDKYEYYCHFSYTIKNKKKRIFRKISQKENHSFCF
jgi:alanine dehydrogenase